MLFVFTGPESTAKSALARALSNHFAVPCIGEVAREYLAQSENYHPSDLLEIAHRQQQLESNTLGANPSRQRDSNAAPMPYAFADTDLQVLTIWWQQRFGPAPTELVEAYAQQGRRHYLLCLPDIEWTPDPLRENPNDRDRLFALYEHDLVQRNLNYHRISGVGESRIACALAAVEAALVQPP